MPVHNKQDRQRPLIGIMQVIEALYLKDEEPHDYLHIKQKWTLCWSYTASGYRLARSQVDLYPPASGADEDSSAHP